MAIVEHEDQPFSVVGILERTGTPVDRSILVSLEGIEAMHVDWQSGMKRPGAGTPADVIRDMQLSPTAVTALMVGLESRSAVFRVQRAINEYREEPLLAILPGVAMQELWNLVGVAENALRIVSWFVVLVGLINLASVLFAGLNERRREMAILRSAGAGPRHVFLLLCAESALISTLGVIAGLILHYITVAIGSVWAQERFGLMLELELLTRQDNLILGAVILAGILSGMLPAWRAYRQTLSDGMMLRR